MSKSEREATKKRENMIFWTKKLQNSKTDLSRLNNGYHIKGTGCDPITDKEETFNFWPSTEKLQVFGQRDKDGFQITLQGRKELMIFFQLANILSSEETL